MAGAWRLVAGGWWLVAGGCWLLLGCIAAAARRLVQPVSTMLCAECVQGSAQCVLLQGSQQMQSTLAECEQWAEALKAGCSGRIEPVTGMELVAKNCESNVAWRISAPLMETEEDANEEDPRKNVDSVSASGCASV